MRITPAQTSFASGELSPRVLGRVDLDAYYTGSASLKNFICLPHGPLLRRAGSTFILEAKSTKVRLVPFVFSITQSMILEFSDKAVRFFFAGGVITGSDGNPLVVTTPYTTEMLPNLNWAQSGDVVYIVHPKVKPQKLSRLANNNWTMADIAFVNPPGSWVADNWPSCVVFHEQRLYYAATIKQPQTVWGSRIGLFDEFTYKNSSSEVTDDMAIEYTIASDDVNGIQWLKAIDILAAGTSGAEYKISSSALNEPITPKNLRISRQTSYGSAQIRPVQIGTGIAFVQRSRNRVRSFEFLFTDNQYAATDLTVLSEHIAQGGIVEMALQTAKDMYLWAITDEGELIGLTYEKQQKVIAWHAHQLGGGGKVRSLAVIPGRDADEVWIAVERTINGVTKVYIEAFLNAFSEVREASQCKFLDSMLSYEGDTEIVQVGGMDHLEGQEVHVLVDGWVHPPVKVERGSIVLQAPGKTIHIGLPYVSEFISTSIQSQETVSVGKKKRIYQAGLSLLWSLGFDFGIVGGTIDTNFMGPTKRMNKAQELFTGIVKVQVPASTSSDQQLIVRQTMPLPLILRSIVYEMEVN